MAKPNYGFEKRQRELAKKKKKEEKRLRKTTVTEDAPIAEGVGDEGGGDVEVSVEKSGISS